MKHSVHAASSRVFAQNPRQLTLAALTGLALLGAMVPSAEAGLQPRVVIDKSSARFTLPANAEVERIVIKFNEGTDIVQAARGLVSVARNPAVQAELKAIDQRARSEGLSLRKLFSRLDAERLKSLKKQVESASGKQLADLNLYFEFPVPPGLSREKLERFVAFLNRQSSVEIAYASAPAEPASIKPPSATASYDANQGYRNAAPAGIDAAWADSIAGGRGKDVRIVDVEGGWRVTHEDMPLLRNLGGAMSDPLWVNHGTAVLGVMGARQNGYGITGLVPDATFGVSGIGNVSPADAILKAGVDAGRGGVVLVELQRTGPADSTPCDCNTSQCNSLPMEYWPAEFDAIQYLTAQGITVVQAAGNGSVNLDDPVYNNAFNRSARDSGAILVGASQAWSRAPACFTNFGSRIDAHGWGESVTTLGYGDLAGGSVEDRYYTASFSGTSSATPIVASAVASIQGVHLTRRGDYMSPSAVRQLIRSTGTAQTDSLDRPIGPLPNLRTALASIAPASSGPVVISGSIWSGSSAAAFTGIGGQGASCSVNAGAGTFSCTVPNGWSGTLTPTHAGSVFTPASRSYVGVQANRAGQDFQIAAANALIRLSGSVTDNGKPLANVQILPGNTSGTASCNSTQLDGSYSCTVSSGWTGTLTAIANGYTFVNSTLSFSNVTASKSGQDFGTAVLKRTATIYYKRGFATPYIHYRPNGGSWTAVPGVAMSNSADYCGYSRQDIDLGAATSVEVAFNDGKGNWDSNGGANYWFSEGISTYAGGKSQPGAPVATACAQSVTFKVTATTVWGENIYIVGNNPALGNWDPAKAVKLEASAYPAWSTTLQLSVPVAFEYKYIRKNSAGLVTWEGGANRSLSLTGGAAIVKEDGNFRP